MSKLLLEKLIRVFGLLSKASARKKIYAQKARQEKRQENSRLLRAISKSESIQARRLFNSIRGQIDISDQYISTIFEKEIEDIIEEYSDVLSQAQQEENKAVTPALFQLRAAERRIMAFYSRETKDVNVNKVQNYFACSFCGYLHIEKSPESCPICGASRKAFQEIP